MKKMRSFLLAVLFILLLTACSQERSPATASSPTTILNEEETRKMLRIEINGTVFQLELADNPTAKKLREILPNTFSMEDLNQNEKFFDLPEHLPKNERAVGEIEAGDVMLYGDSTLVLFYRSFETSYSYTRIGKLLNAEKFAKVAGNRTIVVEIQKEDLP